MPDRSVSKTFCSEAQRENQGPSTVGVLLGTKPWGRTYHPHVVESSRGNWGGLPKVERAGRAFSGIKVAPKEAAVLHHGKKCSFWYQQTRVPALPFTCCTTLWELFNRHEPQPPFLKIEQYRAAVLQGSLKVAYANLYQIGCSVTTKQQFPLMDCSEG